MAAVSAPHASNALTPPASSHDGQNSWNYSVPSRNENPSPSKQNDAGRPPFPQNTNGYSAGRQGARPELQGRMNTFGSGRSADSGYLAPARVNDLSRKDSSISEGSAPDSLLDLYGPNRSGISSIDYGERKGTLGDIYDENDPESSRWIHRDKLARIESEEMQAAGFVLPRARATSKSSRTSRREQSRDGQGNGYRSEHAGQKRQRIETLPAEEESEDIGGWDLRTPEEAAEDDNAYQDISGGVKGVSRIPVLKSSPLPIAMEHLERDTPMRRKLSNGWNGDDEPISYAKSRGRSQSIKALGDATPSSTNATPTPAKRNVSDISPTKKAAGRKGSATGTRAASAPQRPKTRSGPTQATGQRPPTRGEPGATSIKRPEGDPPWLASMYKPDPRLPPDQQILPTHAKRLQQEQWEKEGKFGNAYDTSFRPINDEELRQPEIITQTIEMEEQKPDELNPEWPLRVPKSPALSTGRPGTAGGYSTMPKINPATSPGIGALPSPKPPVRLQEPPEDTKKKGGCGCCVVM